MDEGELWVEALIEENKKLRNAGQALYELCGDIQVCKEGFFWAWFDKFSPEMKDDMKRVRAKFFEVCREWRKASGS